MPYPVRHEFAIIAAMRQEANSTSDKPFKTARKGPKIPKKITETYLSNSGKYYLERFAASTEQFRRVMTRKINKSCKAHTDQSADTCFAMLESVIAKFQDLGFLNDKGYAGGLINSLKNRGWPRNRIILRLKEKGISADLIDELVADPSADENFRNALVWIRRRKLGAYSIRQRGFEKDLAALARAGFDYESANRALSLNKEDIEDYLKTDQA